MPVGTSTDKGRGKKMKKVNSEEIHSLLGKLKEIVPNMPRNRRLSKLEIIQNVIDYIVDLQMALERQPTSNPRIHPRIHSPSPRQPLGVITTTSNSLENTLEMLNGEKVAPSSSEVMSTTSG